jgi:hypothetical protein
MELTKDIAASIYMLPCDEKELMQRDFLKGYFIGNIQRLIMQLEKEAIYYKGETMHIKKKWAKKHLKGYELDFSTKKERYLDGLTDFAKSVLGI